MSQYRRFWSPGGTFFFTVAIADRSSDLLVKHIDLLRETYRLESRRRPFETVAICILPDHLHAIWTLPEGDADYPGRWSRIKSGFSRKFPVGPRSASARAKREKGFWQRRYWEHTIRDETDLVRHIDYIHANPMKHGLVSRVGDWPHSSFHRHVKDGLLPADWGGDTQEVTGSFGE